MRNLVVFLIALLSFFSGGCHIYSTIPFYGYSFEVMNTSDYHLEVSTSGRLMNWQRADGSESRLLSPGQTGSIKIHNFSGSYAQVNISLKAWDLGGGWSGSRSTSQPASRPASQSGAYLMGGAYRSVWVSGYYAQAETWVVRSGDFHR